MTDNMRAALTAEEQASIEYAHHYRNWNLVARLQAIISRLSDDLATARQAAAEAEARGYERALADIITETDRSTPAQGKYVRYVAGLLRARYPRPDAKGETT